ncbi:hypothetical protein EFA46_011205 (plasmid) [Halarchaeum sp. CBA1220]|uniref:hypothetical protein n=1 Tax=Halarchaeum sp. CBA1220 TaxID=1853682 RepID=UPI000F3AA5B5|nr:hypothetical protein [Halarchaeum sp. CBA1220]QLC34824.1 hypothetical protein EFA46_011205 [Halarchaeum sp. CBA1220]
MALHTRRRFLASAAAAGLGALAGCNGSSSSSESAPDRSLSGTTLADPDTVTLRASGNGLLAWVRPRDATTTTESPPRYAGRPLIATDETAERVRFADGVEASAARDFLDATDYGSETVYLEHRSVGACHRLELCYVNWTATSIDIDYGSYYRDASDACEADADDVTAWFIRIPDALEPDAVTSHGSSWSSRGCSPRPAEIENRTERPPLDAGPLPENASDTTSGGER